MKKNKSITYRLGYADIGVLKDQFKTDETIAPFLASVGSYIFLPGIKDDTEKDGAKSEDEIQKL